MERLGGMNRVIAEVSGLQPAERPNQRPIRSGREPTGWPRRLLGRFCVGLLALVMGSAAAAACPSLLDRRIPDLFDHPTDLCAFAGKVVLAVNTASQCGYTPQYEGLEKLYRRFRDRGLVVIGFPANDFGRQEPGSNRKIAEFCQANYGVSFPMFAKSSVIGADANPLFADLAKRSGAAPAWNFHKYLVDRKGERVLSFPSSVDPMNPRFVRAVEQLLAEAPAR